MTISSVDLYVSGDLSASQLRGGEKHAIAVASQLKDTGYKVRLICRGQSELIQRFRTRNIETIALAKIKAPAFLWRLGPAAFIKPTARAIAAEKLYADMALCFSPWLTHSCKLAGSAKRTVQIVADVLTASQKYDRGKTFDFSQWSWIASGPNAWLELGSYTHADISIVSSQNIADALLKSGVAADKLAVAMPAGFEDSSSACADPADALTDRQLWRKRHKIPESAVVVLSSGALTLRKNTQLLIEAMARQGSNTYAVIAGSGPRQKTLQQLAKKLNIEDRVIFTGWLGDMASCYNAADILCHCATYETYGLIYIEAMAHALALLGPKNTPPTCHSSFSILTAKRVWDIETSHATSAHQTREAFSILTAKRVGDVETNHATTARQTREAFNGGQQKDGLSPDRDEFLIRKAKQGGDVETSHATAARHSRGAFNGGQQNDRLSPDIAANNITGNSEEGSFGGGQDPATADESPAPATGAQPVPSGFAFNCCDPDELASCIKLLASDSQLLQRCKQNSARRHKAFNWRTYTSLITDFLTTDSVTEPGT